MKRTVFGLALPLGWLVLAVVPFVLAWDRLPEPIACHWGLSGAPNGALPRISVLAIHAGATGLAAITAWIVTRPGTRSRSVSATCGLTAFVGSLFAVLGVAIVGANLDAPTWHDAQPMPLGVVALFVVAATLAAAAVSRRAQPLDAVVVVPAPSERATVGLANGERATWIASAHNRWVGGIAVALVGVAAAGRTLVPGWSALSCVALALLLAAFAEIHVRVDERGLSIAFGPWRLPRMRIPLARIRNARTIDIAPMTNGGWGYRGSLSILGRAAVIVRGGEGLELPSSTATRC